MLPADARYIEIVETVLKQIRPLISPAPSEAYEGAQSHDRFLEGVESGSRVFGNQKAKNLVRAICSLPPLNCEVEFFRLDEYTSVNVPDGFVSWLAVAGKNKLIIFYDPKPIQLPPGRAGTADMFESNKRLGKIFFHECGHAVLHKGKLDRPLTANADGSIAMPSVEPQDEIEAWWYSLLLWSILVGDLSCAVRKSQQRETAWICA